jgi:hypothetical protein
MKRKICESSEMIYDAPARMPVKPSPCTGISKNLDILPRMSQKYPEFSWGEVSKDFHRFQSKVGLRTIDIWTWFFSIDAVAESLDSFGPEDFLPPMN